MPKSVFGAPFQDRQVYPGAGDFGQWNQDEGSKGHGGSVDGEAFTSGKNAYSKTKEDPALKTPMKGDRQQSSPQTGAIFYQRTLLAGQNGEKDPDTVGKGKAGDKFGAPKGRQFDTSRTITRRTPPWTPHGNGTPREKNQNMQKRSTLNSGQV